jgi:hypothetical protein
MSDILADYREWRDQQAARVSTHSAGCHMWHRDCMIDRLADALERAISGAGKSAQAANTPPTLTDEEREAVSAAACICEDAGRTDIAIAVNTALSRLG